MHCLFVPTAPVVDSKLSLSLMSCANSRRDPLPSVNIWNLSDKDLGQSPAPSGRGMQHLRTHSEEEPLVLLLCLWSISCTAHNQELVGRVIPLAAECHAAWHQETILKYRKLRLQDSILMPCSMGLRCHCYHHCYHHNAISWPGWPFALQDVEVPPKF